jgi:hypothetical protein
MKKVIKKLIFYARCLPKTQPNIEVDCHRQLLYPSWDCLGEEVGLYEDASSSTAVS